MSLVVDRRLNGKNKSIVNRQRFIRRFRSQIKEAVSDTIKNRGITDIDRGEKINIPKRDISEPAFRHGNAGRRQFTQPGNQDFVTGDRISRPPAGGGS
ncbi:MAG: YeaH/YhbH family protein, partial [Gammaproteobacteria bacterium]|nr:YeaH/YhbH family protein [Gammaproteobacteria bacterium]